jgi:hypothetical protein
MDSSSILVSMTFAAASSPVAWAGVRAYRLYGSARLVTCPETMESVLVKIHATRAIASKLTGGNQLRLRSCSRWPEKKDCDQACVGQLTASPDGCRARSLPASSRRAASPVASLSAAIPRTSRSRG